MMKRLPWILLGISILFNFTFATGFLQARSEAIEAREPATQEQAVANALNLTEEQARKYESLRKQARTRAKEVREAIYLARQELWAALAEPQRDAEKVKEIQTRLATLYGEYRELAAEHMGEFFKALTPGQRQTVLAKIRNQERRNPVGHKFWKRFDTDHDGKLSEAERRQAYEDMKHKHTRLRRPGGPSRPGGPGPGMRTHPPRGPGAQGAGQGPASQSSGKSGPPRPGIRHLDMFRQRFDTDGDGKLSEAERQAARRAFTTPVPGGRKGPWDQLPPALKRRLDKDQDGKLSDEEKRAAQEVLWKMLRERGGRPGAAPGQPGAKPGQPGRRAPRRSSGGEPQ